MESCRWNGQLLLIWVKRCASASTCNPAPRDKPELKLDVSLQHECLKQLEFLPKVIRIK